MSAGKFLRRVWAMAKKEVAHVRRDPSTLYLAIGMPLVMIFIFGFGVRFDAEDLPVVWVDPHPSAAGRALRDEITAGGELAVVSETRDVPAAMHELQANHAVGAFVLPDDLADRQARGEPVTVQLLVDGTDGTVANLLLSYAESGVSSAAAHRDRRPPAFVPSVSTAYNPAGQSSTFLLPGTIVYVLALISVLLTSLAVAREWERGSMEQLFATSIGTPEIVIGKLLPYLALATFDVLLALALGAAVFDLPMRGSMLLVALASVLFILGMLGQGLFISIVTRSQMLATQLAAVSAMLPSLLLSGFLFPVANLPLPMRALSHIVPGRFFVNLLRGVLLKGAGWSAHWTDVLFLAVFAVLAIAAATRAFKRRIA